MAEDWLADVRKYDAAADEGVVAKIVSHCGIALRTRNASQVDFSDSKETDKVRESFLKKKLALTDPDATLDAAVAAVGARMTGAEDQNRVTVYYLLAQHFGKLDVFGGVAGTSGTTATAAAASAAVAAAAAVPAPPAPAPVMSAMASTAGNGAALPTSEAERDDGVWGIGCLAGLVVLGAILTGALVTIWANNTILYREPAPVAAPAPAPPPAPAIPDGAGVIAAERDGKPMLTTYFDSGSSDVTPDFATAAADVLAYLEANPGASLQISGFNDPTGNAELNAELSKNRAQNVQAALVALGVAEGSTALVKPDDATTTDMAPEEARRVEVTIIE